MMPGGKMMPYAEGNMQGSAPDVIGNPAHTQKTG